MIRCCVSVFALSLMVLALSCGAADNGDTRSLEGKAAPDFTLTTLQGETVKLSAMKGNVVVIDFWATWCPPCRESLPHLQALSANKDLAAKGLRVWAVNLRENKEKVEQFMKDNNYTFSVPMDQNGQVAGTYLVQGIPTTVIVGKDGNIKNVFVGFGAGSEKRMDEAIEAALK